MAFFDLFKKDGARQAPAIGTTSPNCPYCAAALKKMPGRKTSCPGCGKAIYVRTRPSDQAKILIREDEIELVEEQWAIKNGTHAEYLEFKKSRDEETEKSRSRLRVRFGKEPSDNDVQWGVLNERLLTFGQQMQWGLYRNTRFEMGKLLQREKKGTQALDTFLEVIYIDINGPVNCSINDGKVDQSFLREFPPFDPTLGLMPPGLLTLIEKLRDELKLSEEHLMTRFHDVSTRLHSGLKMLPVNPSRAWKTLSSALAR